ncbi:hypothetical protein BLS_005883 [Venturia inaequalis]|uniref:Complex 1 LYR protein domain-containing protein n=1 Tax=Venturia inaequalis TaxID=5025 RepID=A0A8H3UEY5_VENIN|nr:hypothetical protein BLS_005883 [Venturia inaequalis]
MPPKGAKSRSTKKSQKNKAKAKGKTKAKAKANAENKGPQIKEVELFEDLLEEPEVQGPDFHLMGEDISIWDLQSIVDLWHGTKIHIPILKSDPEGNKELQEEVTLGKIPGCQLHGFEIIRDGLVDADGKVIGAFAVPEYISHSAAKRAWDYIRNKYPYQKVLFPVPDDRFSDRTFRVHMPVVIVDGTLDDPPHDFSRDTQGGSRVARHDPQQERSRNTKEEKRGVGRKGFVPRQSCLHRQAAIALYRALLTQCRASPFSQEDKVSLQHIVRNRFHVNRDKISSRLLKLHFQAGYKALDHLDGAAANDAPSITTIKTYLSQTPWHLKTPRPAPPPPREVPQDHCPPPPEHKFLANFPRPHVEGIRKVPFFVHGHTTFLRYKKPQPYSLSRMIRQTIVQRQNRLNHQDMLQDYYQPLAQYEDAWDKIILQDLGVKDRDTETFSHAAHASFNAITLRLDEQDKRSVAVARVKWDILQQEKALAIKERDERRRIAWEKRQERYKLEGRVPVEGKKALAVNKRDETRQIGWAKRQEGGSLEGRTPIEKKVPAQKERTKQDQKGAPDKFTNPFVFDLTISYSVSVTLYIMSPMRDLELRTMGQTALDDAVYQLYV